MVNKAGKLLNIELRPHDFSWRAQMPIGFSSIDNQIATELGYAGRLNDSVHSLGWS